MTSSGSKIAPSLLQRREQPELCSPVGEHNRPLESFKNSFCILTHNVLPGIDNGSLLWWQSSFLLAVLY